MILISVKLPLNVITEPANLAKNALLFGIRTKKPEEAERSGRIDKIH